MFSEGVRDLETAVLERTRTAAEREKTVLEDESRLHGIYDVTEPVVCGNAVFFAVKRIMDVILSFVSGLALALPMVIIAILIKLDSPGPAIFRQERLGKDGKPFTIYKFRTMYLDAEADGPQWAKRNDCRCTPLGRFLRHTRLDELPQLWNILKGDMSIVGPRPERACFYSEFETYIHGFCYRLLVKPGLTGLAQVNGGYDLKPEEKIVFDIQYIENQSIPLDLKCIFKTVFLVFTHEGAR